jgi:hypothetical protein
MSKTTSPRPSSLDILSTAEKMAIAVLRGGEDGIQAARELAQHLMEDYFDTETAVFSVKKLTATSADLRAVVYVRDGFIPDNPQQWAATTQRMVRQWLVSREFPLIIDGVDRIELFEIHPGSASFEEPPPAAEPLWLTRLLQAKDARLLETVKELLSSEALPALIEGMTRQAPPLSSEAVPLGDDGQEKKKSKRRKA